VHLLTAWLSCGSVDVVAPMPEVQALGIPYFTATVVLMDLGVGHVKTLNDPLSYEGSWLHALLLGEFPESLELRNRDPYRVHLAGICGAPTSTLTARRRDFAPLLCLGARFRFGGLASEHFPNVVAHWPSSYCLISVALAAQAVAPHHSVCGGWSFGATMTVTTKPAMDEKPVTLTVRPDLLPAERTQRLES
jgi:hypothetical protein